MPSNGHDLGQEPRLLDVGDMRLGLGAWQADGSPTNTGHIASLLEKDVRVLSLGGDHAVMFPIVQVGIRTLNAIKKRRQKSLVWKSSR